MFETQTLRNIDGRIFELAKPNIVERFCKGNRQIFVNL